VLGNFIADVQLDQTATAGRGGAQIALMNPGGLRNDLKYGTDGTITYADAFAVQPFANDMVTQTLTGAQVKQALEEQWQPAGASRPVLHLGVSKGLTYTYDASQPDGSRIIAKSLKLNGAVLDPAGSYRVTTNSFLAAGGDNFATLGKGTDRTTTGDNDLTMLVNYFAQHTPVTADPVFRSTAGVLDVTAPTGTYTLVPTDLFTGQSVTLTQTALADDVSAASGITRVVNWGDGSTPETLTATTATHAYPAAGSYPVSVTLTDEAGNSGPAAFTGSSTVTVSAQPGKYTLDKTSIWATQAVTLKVSGATGATKLVVTWGDGITSTSSPSAAGVPHHYVTAGTFTVTVTPYNKVGAGKPVAVGTVKVTKDTYKPTVTLTVPKNPAKASSWSKLTGKTADTGLGVASVRVTLIEKRSGTWYYYNGSTWNKASSRSAASAKAKVLVVTPTAKGGWTRSVQGVKKGTLKVTYWAVDKAGNTATAKTYTAKITR
jgi:5'-nucleotidase